MSNKFSTKYAYEVYHHLVSEYNGTWLPNQKIKLGDIGTMNNGVFKSLNQNITDDGFLKFEVEYEEGTNELHNMTTGVSNLSIIGSASAGLGSAQTEISFNKDFGAWVKIPKYQRCYITKLGIVGKALVTHLYQKDPKFWVDKVIITELLIAQSGNVLISDSKGAKIMLDINLRPTSIVNIAGASISANSNQNGNTVNEYPLSEGSTPFFKFGMFKKGWLLNGAEFIPMADDDKLPVGAVEGIVFRKDVSFNDLPIEIEEE